MTQTVKFNNQVVQELHALAADKKCAPTDKRYTYDAVDRYCFPKKQTSRSYCEYIVNGGKRCYKTKIAVFEDVYP